MGERAKTCPCSTGEDQTLEICHVGGIYRRPNTLRLQAFWWATTQEHGAWPSVTYHRRVTRDEWLTQRTWTDVDVDPTRLAALKRVRDERIAVVIPARQVADTIGQICSSIRETWMEAAQIVDELVVVNAPAGDDTARVARAAGATVVDEAEVLPDFAAAGKGAAMWRSLAVTSSQIIVWIDGDIDDFDPLFVGRLVVPLLEDPDLAYVKGFFERPLGGDPTGGGRVSEICARPLINRFRPDLAGFVQPLAGEAAGRRAVLEQVPFMSGYAVEIGLLWDIHNRAGLAAMGQVDLGVRRHRNQPTAALGRMAYSITEAVLRREGLTTAADQSVIYERPFAHGGRVVMDSTPLRVDELPPMASIVSGKVTG